MATVTERHAGGRPPEKQRTRAFYLLKGMAERRGMDLRGLASAAGLDLSGVYKIRDPKLSTLKGIAEAPGIPLGRLASRVAAVESEAAR